MCAMHRAKFGGNLQTLQGVEVLALQEESRSQILLAHAEAAHRCQKAPPN